MKEVMVVVVMEVQMYRGEVAVQSGKVGEKRTGSVNATRDEMVRRQRLCWWLYSTVVGLIG